MVPHTHVKPTVPSKSSSSEDNSFPMSVPPGPSQANASDFIEAAPALVAGARCLYDGRGDGTDDANGRFDLDQP